LQYLLSVVLCQHSKSSKLSLNTDDFLFLDSSRYHHVSSLKDTAIFRFGSPLYFATLDVFKKQLFASSVSISALRAREKLTNKGKHIVVAVKVVDGKPPLETSDIDGKCKAGDVVVEVESSAEKKKSKDQLAGAPDGPNNGGSALLLEPVNGKLGNDEACDIKNIIVECSTIPFVDTAGCRLLAQMHGEYCKFGVKFILAGCCDDVVNSLKKVDQCQTLCKEALYPSVHSAVLCLHHNLFSAADCQ